MTIGVPAGSSTGYGCFLDLTPELRPSSGNNPVRLQSAVTTIGVPAASGLVQ